MSNGIWRKISIQVLTSLDYTHRNEKKNYAEIKDLEKVTKIRDTPKVKINKGNMFQSKETKCQSCAKKIKEKGLNNKILT